MRVFPQQTLTANLDREDDTDFFPSTQFLPTSGYWAYILTMCSDLNTAEFRYLIAAKLGRQIDQWKDSMMTTISRMTTGPQTQTKTWQELDQALRYWCMTQIVTKTSEWPQKQCHKRQKTKTNERHGLPKWTNEVQIKYKTTRTSEIQTHEPNRTRIGNKTGTKREQSGTKRTRIWLKQDTNRVQNQQKKMTRTRITIQWRQLNPSASRITFY